MLQRLTRWFNAGVVGLTLGAYLAPWIDPNVFWPPAFLGLLFPFLLLLHLACITFWLIHRQWYWIFSVLALLAGWPQLRSIFGLAWPTKTKQAETLRVMTYNIYGFGYIGDRPLSLQLWRDQLTQNQPDILCLQEFAYYPLVKEQYLPELTQTAKLPHSVWRRTEEFAIFSRYPILDSKVKFFGTTNGYRYADVQLNPRQIVRVFNVHLQSNAITGLTNAIAQRGNLKEERTWRNIRGIMGRFKRAAARRAQQAAEIATVIAASPYPVILCGDLNDVPQSRSYHLLTRQLDDTFQLGGGGLAFTYAGKIPGLRIDYILCDPSLEVRGCWRGATGLSDHRPVIADLVLPLP